MSKTLRTSTGSQHEPLLARLMKSRPLSLSEQSEKPDNGMVSSAMPDSFFTSWKHYPQHPLAERGARLWTDVQGSQT
jgi:hypothetical protein